MNAIVGDRAIEAGEEDRLGFNHMARQVAMSLVDPATRAGMVVALEGAWGSGKSSFLFLVSEELRRLPEQSRPSVIAFRPWLIGNREALVTNLFRELLAELERLAASNDASKAAAQKAKQAAVRLRLFMNALGKAGEALEVAADFVGWLPLKWLGSLAKALLPISNGSDEPSLANLKESLVSALRDMGRRFVITVDDVDRLEPAEVIEVLRLVRSVVDLPNVVYVLCYDREILAHSVERAAGVKNGEKYLEKIIQLSVMVPRPQPFELRQWFTDDLGKFARARNEDEHQRLQTVVDIEGGRHLSTPRAVIRALDAIRFSWSPLREAGGDLADLVWLAFIKDGCPALYRWIEEYCASASVLSLGMARIDDNTRKKELAALVSAVPEGYFEGELYCHHFAEQLPGIEIDLSQDNDVFHIFGEWPDHARKAALNARRLASPDHYRLYFAMSGPAHALSLEDFERFGRAAAVDHDEVARILLAMQGEAAGGTLTRLDLMLERLRDGAHEALDADQSGCVLMALATVMDDARRARKFGEGFLNTGWDRARRLSRSLLGHLAADRRAEVLVEMFGKGNALGWLADILRRELFAHGRVGNGERTSSERLVSSEELDGVISVVAKRYEELSAGEAFSVPNPITLLFNWLDLGDGEGPRRLVEENVVSDVGLVETLETLRSTITTSDDGSFKVLKRETLSSFIDADRARGRLEKISSHPELGERASSLLEAFRRGDSY